MMEKKSKIYIAGHTGLVGSNLVKTLRKAGYGNLLLRTREKLDLTRQSDTEAFFMEEKPEFVFLAAAKVGGILANSTYKAEFIYNNLAIAMNVIHSSWKTGVKKLLNLGSSCIYPKNALQPLKEDYLLTGALEPTNEPYAVAKIAAIKLCRYYNEQYGTDFISAMPTNLYGPGDNFNLETSHVLPGLLRKFHLAKLLHQEKYNKIRLNLSKNPLGYGFSYRDELSELEMETQLNQIGIFADRVRLWGSGKAYREFLFIEDLSDACLFLMKEFSSHAPGKLINIGTGKDLQISELALMIRKLTGFSGEVCFDTEKPDGTPKKLLDVSRINKTGWKAFTDLEDGIKRLYDWYLSKK